ncbi:MAG: hypothetical protein ACP5QO_02475 [Clostridia bacterium]
MAVPRNRIGRNVEILVGGPALKGRRLGTLSVDDQGLHFRANLLPPWSWHIAWEQVADIQVGAAAAMRWSNFLPMKVAHQATHLTILDVDGRQQGFVVPDVPQEHIHNCLAPSAPRWNHGKGVRS